MSFGEVKVKVTCDTKDCRNYAFVNDQDPDERLKELGWSIGWATTEEKKNGKHWCSVCTKRAKGTEKAAGPEELEPVDIEPESKRPIDSITGTQKVGL